MQVAIFGGSFDPVHIGHVNIVNKALDFLDIDKLFVIPTFLNPLKSSFDLAPNKRKNLLLKVFKDYKKVEICDYEIKQNKAVYSLETIKHIKEKYKTSKIYFIIGADNLKSLDKWYKIEEIKELTEFIVAKREGFEIENNLYKTLETHIDISSSLLRENLDLNYIPNEIKEDIIKLK